MVRLVEALLHPYRVPGIGKAIAKVDPLSAKLDKTVSDRLDYDYRPDKDDPKPWFKCGGKVKRKKFSKGGVVDDLAPRENLPPKNASEQAKDAKRKKPKPEDDLAPRENLPTKRYAKGGMVRGDGCCVKGKTKGRFR